MSNLVKKATLAEMAGVKPPSLSSHFKQGGRLYEALSGSKVDLDHPAVREYLEYKRGDRTDLREVPPETTHETASAPQSEAVPESIEPFADLTLRDLIHRFGTDERFETWLKSLKTIEEIEDKRVKNMAAKKELISREVVDQFVFGALEEAFARLLNDSPKTIAGQVRAAVNSGSKVEEVEELVRDLISAQLKGVKRRAQKAVEKA